MSIQSKVQAQQRADQIASFKKELEIIEKEGLLALEKEQQQAISMYHRDLIDWLSQTFDIDTGKKEKQLSLGMKIVSFLGAIGLAASIFFFFYQFWGYFSTHAQVLVLTGAPVIAMAGTVYTAGKEKTGYFTKILGLLSVACFVLNIVMLGQIFNITPSPNACLVWAIFAAILAYAANARLLLVAGILSLTAFLSAKAGTWGGCYWLSFGERPENFFPAAVLLFLISLIPHHKFDGFCVIYRVFALLILFIPILILANWGSISYLPFSGSTIEIIYQIAGFAGCGLAIWAGIKNNWPEIVNTGNVFFTIFLYTKFYDWWWQWMPKYLFFLIIALTAIMMLVLLTKVRNKTRQSTKEVAS